MSFVKLFFVSVAVTILIFNSVSALTNECEKKCRLSFPAKNPTDNGVDNCERGCRLFLLVDGVTKPKDQTESESMTNCKHSCEDSFDKVKDKSEPIAACQSGCEFQKSESPKSVKISKIEESKEDNENNVVVPFLTIQLPNMFDDIDMDLGLPSWASDMRKSMDEMHKRMMTWMKNGLSDDKLFSGDLKNDMMSKPNPLDQFFDSSNFEILDSSSSNADKSNDGNFGGNRVFEIEIIGPYQLDSAQINGLDFKEELEPPRLPEEGLKTRQDAESIYLDFICKRDSREMSWSDLVSCIHHRMRTPRWLTVATISLSIIFILWLCLVIPNNAPKQKVKKEKEVFLVSANAKEKEALSFVSIRMSNGLPNDLPPSYEEIANLQVKLEPVHQSTTPSEEKTKSTKI